MTRSPFLAATLVAALLVPAASPAEELGSAAWRAADDLAGALVLVEYVLEREGRAFAQGGQRLELAAAGVIATEDGLVIVSDGVFPDDENDTRSAARPASFVVRLADGRLVPATLAGRDDDLGIALLQLAADGPWPHARFESGPALRRGSALLVPLLLPERYGYRPSFRRAAVGAVLPGSPRRYDLDAFVQDASLGLPALDADGRVAGLVTIDRFENGGPSAGPDLPLTLISTVTRGKAAGYPVLVAADELLAAIENPPVWQPEAPGKRAWIGVTLQEVDRKLAEYLGIQGPSGILVTSVWEGSPADEAGLRPEDVIVRFAGKDVEAPDDEAILSFIDRVQGEGVGTEVELEVLRGDKRRKMKLRLGEAPVSAVQAEEFRSERLGLVAQDLTMDIIQGRGWPRDTRGAIVSDLEMAGAAMVGGLQPGDLILAVDGRAIGGVTDLAAALDGAQERRQSEIVFFVLRDPDTLFVVVKPQD